jgi:Fur family peroxide stress response transcriptional regulator
MKTRTDLASTLRQNGYRATPQRLAIYDAIWSAGDHPTVAEIHEAALERDPTISLATVYKALRLLTDIGLTREIAFRDGSTRYDPVVDGHINLVCNKCGKIEDFDFKGVSGLKSEIENRSKFLVLGQSLEVYGYCSKCKSGIVGGKQEI